MRIWIKEWMDSVAGITVALLAFSSLAFWWPQFAAYSRLAFICCFPVGFPFSYYLVRSDGSLQKTWKRKTFRRMIGFHSVLFVSFMLLSRVFPPSISIDNPDLIFAFIAIEIAAILLMCVSGQKVELKRDW